MIGETIRDYMFSLFQMNKFIIIGSCIAKRILLSFTPTFAVMLIGNTLDLVYITYFISCFGMFFYNEYIKDKIETAKTSDEKAIWMEERELFRKIFYARYVNGGIATDFQ